MIVTPTVIANLCVYLLTWNVASKPADDVDMRNMLTLNGTTSCPGGQLPDLYVLGFQEVKVGLMSMISPKENEWTLKIQDHLSVHDYVRVGTEQLQGILINVWSQSKHLQYINDIETTMTKTGLYGLWGNKGAVSLRMNLYDTPTSFVVSHLAAHDDKLKQRIDDFNTIIREHQYKIDNYPSIYHHEVIFWSGDLNFRLNGRDSATTISNKIRKGQLDELFALDELQMVKRTEKAFSLFNEEKPMFSPTYKFHEGTSEYNLKRRPAWCDRILYRVQSSLYPYANARLQQLSYKSHPQYVQSDHKPVTAEFLLVINGDQNIYSGLK